MDRSNTRVLLVDDFVPFLEWVYRLLQDTMEIVARASDGLEAVQIAEALQPDLILLDIGLPKLNGIEAARRIGNVAPNSKILFVSMESSPDVVQEAIRVGALGYVAKGKAATELLKAIELVLQGKQFVSPSLSGGDPTDEGG